MSLPAPPGADSLVSAPPPATAGRRSRWGARVGLAAWFAVMLFVRVVPASGADSAASARGWIVFLGALPLAAVETLMLFAAVRLTRRYLLGCGHEGQWRNAAVHAAAAVTFGVASYAAAWLASPWVPPTSELSAPTTVALNVGFYGLLTGVAHAVEYARRYRRTEATGLRLRAELAEARRRRAEAELRVLKAEL